MLSSRFWYELVGEPQCLFSGGVPSARGDQWEAVLQVRLGGLWEGCWIRVWGVCDRVAGSASRGSVARMLQRRRPGPIAQGERRSGSVFRFCEGLFAFVVAGRLPPSARRSRGRGDTAALWPMGSLASSWPVGGGPPRAPTTVTLGKTHMSFALC